MFCVYAYFLSTRADFDNSMYLRYKAPAVRPLEPLNKYLLVKKINTLYFDVGIFYGLCFIRNTGTLDNACIFM